MAEWLKASASKADKHMRVSGVQIPPSPPYFSDTLSYVLKGNAMKRIFMLTISLLLMLIITLSACNQQALLPELEEKIEISSAMFRSDPQRSGVYTSLGPQKYNTPEWSFKAEDAIESSPAIAYNTVFFGCADGNIYAVDAYSGILKWKTLIGSGIYSSRQF